MEAKKMNLLRGAGRLLTVSILIVLIEGCGGGVEEAVTGMGSIKGEWPIFRGDTGLSGATDIELPENPVLLWRCDTEGEIVSSPVIGHGMVFIGSNNGKVYGIGLYDGKIKWQFSAERSIEAPPLLLDGTVYIGDMAGNFYAIESHSGTLKWSSTATGDIMGSANWAEDPGTGKKTILVGSYDSKMYSFDAETGGLNWTYETGYYINGAPAVDGGMVVFGGCDQVLHVVSASGGEKKSEVDAGSYIAGSASFLNGQAYVGNYSGRLVSIDVDAGKIIWEYEDREERAGFFSSPAVTSDRVYIGSRDNALHCMERSTGEKLWKFRTRGKIDSSPVVAGDKVVFGSADGRIYVIDRMDGAEIWSYDTGSPVLSSPAVIGGLFVIASADGRVYAFGESR